MFLLLSYATQEAFLSNQPIEIQKAKGFRVHRSNGKISYYNASTEPHDGGRASFVHNDISRCHPSCRTGTGAGQQSTSSGRYRERACRGGVQDEVSVLTEGSATQFTAQPLSLPSNSEPFASIAVTIGSRVSPKLRAKIWANESIEFGALLTSSPNQVRFSVCLTPSSSSSNQPRLTLKPCQPSKNMHTFLQWLSSFNVFAAFFL